MERKVAITNEDGLHARPASLFVKEANKWKCEIFVQFKSNKINAKSIVGIMSLGVSKGDEIKIITEGKDEEEALNSLIETIDRGLKTDIR